MDKTTAAPACTGRSALRSRTDIETRVIELSSAYAAQAPALRDEATATEIEVLAAAVLLDPVAPTPGGEIMPLSRALTALDLPSAVLKQMFSVVGYARDFDDAYDLAREVLGHDVAFILMEDVLTETEDHVMAANLAIHRMVCPTSRYRKYVRRAAEPARLQPACV